MKRNPNLYAVLLAMAVGCGRLEIGEDGGAGSGAVTAPNAGGSGGGIVGTGGRIAGTAGSKFATGGDVSPAGGSGLAAGSGGLSPLGDGGVGGYSGAGSAGEGGRAGEAGAGGYPDVGAGGTPPEGPDTNPAPSCKGSELRCGVDGDSCCQAYLAPAGTFTIIDEQAPPQLATVRSFVLDRYEVTVARFRRFVADYERWRAEGNPREGDGAYYPVIGWQASWDTGLPNTAADLVDAMTECTNGPPWVTWSETDNDTLPINCINWHEAFAFCLWDGGRLPTETEFDYATAGGEENRLYPWGAAPEPTPSYAVYGCQREREPLQSNGMAACSMNDILPVGSKPLGFGRWRHADLAGSMAEWVLNLRTQPGEPSYEASQSRMFRGGAWSDSASSLRRSSRSGSDTALRVYFNGVRCARTLDP